MKRIVALLSSVAVLCTSFTVFNGTDVNAADGVAINATNFPDEVFRTYLSENFDTDSDGVFSSAEIANVKIVDIESSEVASIEGVEFFTSLKKLDTFNNPITSMDLSKNTKLETLTCGSNQLTALDVSNNTALTYLSCAYNSLTSLDVSKNTLLEDLYCYNNSLTKLDVSHNTLLDTLYCSSNQLTSIDVSNNTMLKDFKCNSNQISSLDLSKCTKLFYLYCSNNLLTSLDLSNLAELYYLECTNNQITSLNLSKNAKLKYLYCYDNLLTKLDLSNNTAIETVNCRYNQITNLNLSNCSLLEDLYCNNNSIKTLQLSDCTSLKYLSCPSNLLTELDISKNTLLNTLICYSCKIDAIDVSQNTALKELNCNSNNLADINISNNINLKSFNCSYNQLTTLDISNNTNLESLNCSENQLTSLDISNCDKLSTVYCSGNNYNIGNISPASKSYDLSNLPEKFDPDKASNWQGATYENGMLTNIEGVNGTNVKYTYDIGGGITKEFSLSFTFQGEITYQYLSFNTKEQTYLADNTTNEIHPYAFLHYIFPELEEGTFAMSITDFCDITTFVSPDASLDVNNTSSDNATKENVSPFDLYWSAYNEGFPENEFVYTYRIDMSKIDALFNRINARTGYGLSYEDDFDLFANILYDESGKALDLATQTINISQKGDATLDHTIDAKDAAAIAKYIAQATISSNATINSTDNELGVFAADTNGDGFIDAKDAANVAKFSSQKAVYSPDTPDSQSYYEIWNKILN